MVRKIFFTALTMIVAVSGLASHIVGGNFVVVQTGANTYLVTLRVYRDCCSSCSNSIVPSAVRVYDNVTNAQVSTINMGSQTVTSISLGDECYTPTGICLEEYYFQTTTTLANNPNGYYFAWNICCRNSIIANLQSPSSLGSTFYVQVPDPAIAGGNSSPDFGPYPTDGYLCVNNVKTFNFGVTDPDGDSLVYSLIEPFDDNAGAKPFSPITWAGGYSLTNIVGGTPVMSINPITGDISAAPSATGTYVFAVKVEEYRNGIKIGEVVRDVQYHALNCIFDDLPAIYLPDSLYIEVFSEGCVDIVVKDPDAGDTVSITVATDIISQGGYQTWPTPYQVFPDTTYLWYFTDSLGNSDSAVLGKPVFDNGAWFGTEGIGLRYCWPTDCNDIREMQYTINVEAFSIGCSGDTNTFDKEIALFVIPPSGDNEIVPNVFSPNGDGMNDVFRLDGVINPCYDSLQVEIYNRWGQLMFESVEVDFSWDGKDMKGKEVAEGTYYVLLKGTFGDLDVTRQYALTLFRSK